MLGCIIDRVHESSVFCCQQGKFLRAFEKFLLANRAIHRRYSRSYQVARPVAILWSHPLGAVSGHCERAQQFDKRGYVPNSQEEAVENDDLLLVLWQDGTVARAADELHSASGNRPNTLARLSVNIESLGVREEA